MKLPVLKQPPGYVVYQGPSAIDGGPIVALATGFLGNENPKTGNMIQIWILRSDMRPTEAYADGADASVCGNCKHRTFGTCYVNVFQGPYSVYDAYKRGNYHPLPSPEVFAGRKVRLGSYGDPAAVPYEVFKSICDAADGQTGYTHQWRTCDLRWRKLVMASVDTEQEFHQARKGGWRTFRVRLEGDPVLKGEFACPASVEAGKRLTCQQCMACGGGVYRGQGTPVIIAHGPPHKRNAFTQIMSAKRKHRTFRPFLRPDRLKLREAV